MEELTDLENGGEILVNGDYRMPVGKECSCWEVFNITCLDCFLSKKEKCKYNGIGKTYAEKHNSKCLFYYFDFCDSIKIIFVILLKVLLLLLITLFALIVALSHLRVRTIYS